MDEQKTEKQSSIEVSRNAKGEIALKCKLYFDEEKEDWKNINTKIEEIISDLKRRFNINS